MVQLALRRMLLSGVVVFAWLSVVVLGQESAKPTTMVHVLGLEKIKRNSKCKLTVQKDAVQFVAGRSQMELSIPLIRDVFTDQDSKRLVGGKLGTLSTIAAPYETGRIISLFREKIDVLTLEFQDSNGGLHGAVFTLPKGQAVLVKKQLVAQGARASIPVDEETEQERGKVEKKP